MMNQSMRREAAFNALVYPTLWVGVLLMFALARGEAETLVWWHYVLAFLVLYVRDFYSERRKLLKKAGGVK